MDLTAIISDIGIVLNLGKLAVQVGMDSAPYLEKAWELATKKTTLTDAERTAMAQQEEQMRATIDAAIADDDAAS